MTEKQFKITYREEDFKDFKELSTLINQIASHIATKLINSDTYEEDLVKGEYLPYMLNQLLYLKSDMRAIEKLIMMGESQNWDEEITGYVQSNLCVWVFESCRFITRFYLRTTNIIDVNWPEQKEHFSELMDWYKSKGSPDEMSIRYVRNTVSHYDSDLQYADDYGKFIKHHKDMEGVDSKLDALDRNSIAYGIISSSDYLDAIKKINITLPIITVELLDLNDKEKELEDKIKKLRTLAKDKIQDIIAIQDKV